MAAVSEEAIEIASDFVSRSNAPRKSARLSSALLNYSRPEGINLVPLGTSCGLDLFARLHNGIRRELIDMYNMIDSMQRRVEKLRTSDLKLFFRWWDLFSSYLEVTFECHEQVLWKWILKKTTLSNTIPDAKREEMKESVTLMLKGFDSVYNQMSRRPPDETMAKLIKGLASMHPIVEFLGKIEASVPEVVEEYYTPRDIRKLEKQVASYLHKTGDSDFRRMHLQVMTRAMTEEVLSAWQKTISPLLRFSYRASSKRFSTAHLAVVQKLAVE